MKSPASALYRSASQNTPRLLRKAKLKAKLALVSAFPVLGARDAGTRWWRVHHQLEERGWALGCWTSLDLSRRAKVIETLALFTDARTFLELGCHVGSNLRLLAIALRPERLTGLDVNDEAVQMGRTLFTEERVDNVRLECGDFLSVLPRLPDKSEDVIFSCYSLAYVHPDDLERVLGHALRIARLGIVVAEPQVRAPAERRGVRHKTFEWNHDYRRAFRNLGIFPAQLTFTDLEVDDLHHMNAILVVNLSREPRSSGRAMSPEPTPAN